MVNNNNEDRDGSNEEVITRREAKRPRWIPLIVILIILIVGSPFGYRWYIQVTTSETTDDATIKADVVSVSSKISGTAVEIAVGDNQRVEAGQVLVKLDTRDLDAAVAQAQAAYELAVKNADAAQSGIGLSNSQTGAQTTSAEGGVALTSTAISVAEAAVETSKTAVDSAQSKLDQAKVSFDLADKDYQRAKKLADEGVIAQQTLDHAESAYKLAQAGVDTAKSDLTAAQSRLTQAELNVKIAKAQRTQSEGALQGAVAGNKQTEMRQKQYEAALAQVDLAKTALDAAQLQLSYTTITAPSAGRTGKVTVLAGQRVSPGQPLMPLVKDDTWVVANYKETQLQKIQLGMPVDITVDAIPGKVFKAHVDSMSPASGATFALLPPDNATGNYTKVVQRIPVKMVFEEGEIKGYENLLTPGMSVIVRVWITQNHKGN